MKYIKHQIPDEISDKGGASVQLVQKQTIPLDGAIDAAIEAHYAIGQKEFIRNGVLGTMKSMSAGVRRDGRPRSIEGFLTVYPVFKGPIDLEKGFDPAVNKVQIKARLLNELELDISNWTFEDVTPGKKPFRLNTVKAGSVLDEYRVGETGNLNGSDLPSTANGEELRIHWVLEGTDKSGDIPAAKMTSDVSRIDIAADALAELADDEYDGKTIVFTVRGNFSSGKISATLRAETPVPTVTDVTLDGTPFDEVESVNASGISIDAENWSRTPDDRFVVTYTDDEGGTKVIDRQLEDGGAGSGATGDLRPEMEEKLIPLDSEVEFKLLLHGGVEGSPDQVFTTRLALMR